MDAGRPVSFCGQRPFFSSGWVPLGTPTGRFAGVFFGKVFSPGWQIRRPLGAPPRRTRWVFCRGCRSALESWVFLGKFLVRQALAKRSFARSPRARGARAADAFASRRPAFIRVDTACFECRAAPARDCWSRILAKQRELFCQYPPARGQKLFSCPDGPSKTKFCQLTASTRGLAGPRPVLAFCRTILVARPH